MVLALQKHLHQQRLQRLPCTSCTASSTFQFKLPDIGEGIAEGEIVKIDIKVGDKIAEDDILFEVQNDKSVESIPSPVAGTVTAV